MQIVIEISEKEYNYYKDASNFGGYSKLREIILNGTVLPKGHGRLIDKDDLCITTVPCLDDENEPFRYVSAFNLKLAPTIIEADKAEGVNE